MVWGGGAVDWYACVEFDEFHDAVSFIVSLILVIKSSASNYSTAVYNKAGAANSLKKWYTVLMMTMTVFTLLVIYIILEFPKSILGM